MFPKPLHPKFREFLYDRGLLLRFHINTIIGAESIADYYDTRKVLSEYPEPFFIGCAFDWDGTSEGYDYWHSISRKWEIQLAFLKSGNAI